MATIAAMWDRILAAFDALVTLIFLGEERRGRFNEWANRFLP